jgi:hypothetical protein
MDEEILLSQLEELAERLGILVRDENINIDDVSSTGGLCIVEGQHILILNSKTTVTEKIQVAIRALRQFDISEIYVKPGVRELLDEMKRGQANMNKSHV